MTKDYVALSDVELYGKCYKSKKEQGFHDIEFFLRNLKAGEWMDQVIDFEQFKREIIGKGREYI